MISSRSYKLLSIALFVAIILIMVIVVFEKKDFLLSFHWIFNAQYLPPMLISQAMALGITFVVWHLLVSRLGNFNNIKTNFRYYYISTLTKRIPTSFWYIGGRLAMYRGKGVPSSVILNCLLLENIVIGLAGISVFLLFLPFYSWFFISPEKVTFLILLGGGGTSILLTQPRAFIKLTNKILRHFQKQELITRLSRRDIILWWGLYTLPWILAGFSLFFTIKMLTNNVEIRITDTIGISTLSMLVALLSMLLPSGLGLKEITTSVLLSHWIPLPTAIVISIIYRLIQTGHEMIWASIAIYIPSDRK